jgi:AcrR family transcriptional regulator
MSDSGTRAYQSTVRAEQAAATRLRILSAATELFSSRGWSGTGMRDVATLAGVAVETIYKNYPTKGALLIRVLEVAVVGDDEPIAVADRPEYLAMASGSVQDRARAAADLVTAINARHAPLVPAMREAATQDAAVGEFTTGALSRRHLNVREGASLIARRAVTEVEADGLWAVLSPDAYLLITKHAGWTDDDYRDWAADVIVALLSANGFGADASSSQQSRGERP